VAQSGAEQQVRSPITGSQWEPGEYARRTQDGRPTYQINDVALAVHALSGQEITGRFKPSFAGRYDDVSPQSAEALNVANRQIREMGHAEHVESEAFLKLLQGGYSFIELYQDHLSDFRGRTTWRSYDLWDCMWDSTARESMLLDREWDAAGWWLSMDHFLAMYPDRRSDLLGYINRPDGWIQDEDLGESARWPFLYRAIKGRYVNPKRREVFLCDYQWRQREPLWAVEVPKIDPQTGQPMPDPEDPTQPLSTLQAMDEEQFLAYRDQFRFDNGGHDPAFVGPEDNLYRWKYHRATILGDKVLKEYPALSQFSRTCLTGFPFRQMERVTFHGIVDYMKDPQRFKNAGRYADGLDAPALDEGRPGDRPQRLRGPGAASPPTRRSPTRSSRRSLACSCAGRRCSRSSPSPPTRPGWTPSSTLADMAVWRPTGMNPDVLGQLRNPQRVSGVVFNSACRRLPGTVLGYLFNSLKWGRQVISRAPATGDHLEAVRRGPDPRAGRARIRKSYIPPQEEWEEFFDRQVLVDETEANTKDQRLQVWEHDGAAGHRREAPHRRVHAGGDLRRPVPWRHRAAARGPGSSSSRSRTRRPWRSRRRRSSRRSSSSWRCSSRPIRRRSSSRAATPASSNSREAAHRRSKVNRSSRR
jgi:hypothetical protein